MNNETLTVPQWDLQHPAANYRMATDVAGLCKEIVTKSAVNISGKKYVRCEGWMAIATAHGCVASSRDVEHVEGGLRAIGEIRKIQDGIVIALAEGFVGDDEPTWAERPEYARRAMAQTRAISRACRSAFAHVVVLMDAGLSTTPAEEVPDGGFEERTIPASPKPTTKPKGDTFPANPLDNSDSLPERRGEARPDWREVLIHFGKNKNVRLGDLEPGQLKWYASLSGDGWEPRPFKGKFSDADVALFNALNEYRLTQGKPARVLPGQQSDEELGKVPF